MKAKLSFQVLWLAVCICVASLASAAQYQVYSGGVWSYPTDLNSAISTFNLYQNSILKIPAGTHSFSTQILPKANSAIIGDSELTSWMVAAPYLNGSDLIKVDGNCVAIWNIRLTRETNTRSSVTGNGINVNGHSAVSMNHLAILRQNIGITSSNTQGLLTVTDAVMDRVFISFTKSQGIYLQGADITISNCKCQYIAGTAVELYLLRDLIANPQPCVNILASGFQLVGGNGVLLHGMGDNTTEGNKILIDQCFFDQITQPGIQFDNCSQVSITKNRIRRCGTSVTPPSNGSFEYTLPAWPGWSIYFGAGEGNGIKIPVDNDHITIEGNTICNNAQSGIYMENWSTYDGPSNVIIANNQIYNTTRGGACGIEAWTENYGGNQNYYMRNVTITGNQIHGFANFGILLGNNHDRYIIMMNTLNDNYINTSLSIENSIYDHNIEY